MGHRPSRTAVSDRCGEGSRLCIELAAVHDGPISAWPVGAGRAELTTGQSVLPGGTSDIGGDDVDGVPVQTAAGAVVSHGGPGIGVRGGFLHVPQRDPGVQRGSDERVPQRVRPDRLGDPGTAGHPAHDRPAQWRSSRCPSPRRKTGPSLRSPMARSIARAVRGASGTVTTLPPLGVTTRVRCPRSTPRAWMSAPTASDTRSPLRASSEMSA